MAKKRQLEIVGAERKVDDQMEAALEAILDYAAKRIEAKEAEDTARQTVSDRMREMGIGEYTYCDGEERYTVKLVERQDSISIRKAKGLSVEVEEEAA